MVMDKKKKNRRKDRNDTAPYIHPIDEELQKPRIQQAGRINKHN